MQPQKIISLVPSITQLLFDLGLQEQIVGRTKFCIHPADKIKNIPTIGGTKNLDLKKIIALNPDLIFATKEENEKAQVEELQNQFNIYIKDVCNLEDNYNMISDIGKLTHTETRADAIILKTKDNFKKLKEISNKPVTNKRALYLIWRKPYMTIGSDTFIHSMMESIGLENVFGNSIRYPVIDNLSLVKDMDIQLVLLSSEPYPFKENHIAEIRIQLPAAKILLVDGEYFSWYGSRIMESPEYFEKLLQQID